MKGMHSLIKNLMLFFLVAIFTIFLHKKKLDLIEMFVSFWGKLVYLEDKMCE